MSERSECVPKACQELNSEAVVYEQRILNIVRKLQAERNELRSKVQYLESQQGATETNDSVPGKYVAIRSPDVASNEEKSDDAIQTQMTDSVPAKYVRAPVLESNDDSSGKLRFE